MSHRAVLYSIFILALLLAVSCSGGDENIITPAPIGRDVVSAEASGGTLCLGLWQIVIDKNTGTGDILQLRTADKIINVLGFMEPPALFLMDLDWDHLVIDGPNETIEVGVILTHPIYGDPVFTGFDVRGVCFGPEVANADGLTIIPGPEYFSGVPFGYIDGLLGAPDSFANYEGLAGYKYYCDGLGADEDLADFMSDTGNLANRGSYASGSKNQRNYFLDWKESVQNFFIFNYAIYANYDWPVGDPPIDLDSFEISGANSAEAFCCRATELANSLWFSSGSGGGSISLQVEVWDWLGDIAGVTIESVVPGIITQTSYDTALGNMTTDYSYGFEFNSVPGNPDFAGMLDILITVTDAVTFGDAWFMDLMDAGHDMYNVQVYNCFTYPVEVLEGAPPTPVSMDPDTLVTYDSGMSIPGLYENVAVTGSNFQIGGGVSEAYLTDGVTQIDAEDINVVSDTQLNCTFDIRGFSGDDGLYDLVVVTTCDGIGEDLATIADNILFMQDFADGDGGCEDPFDDGYQYCASDGWWEETTCGSDHDMPCCHRFVTPAFDVPSAATDVHYRMQHSGLLHDLYFSLNDGWTFDDGNTFYGDIEDGVNTWKYESGQDHNSQDYNFAMFFGSGCLGITPMTYSGWAGNRYSSSWGGVGSGVWSQFHLDGTENLLGASNARFMLVLWGTTPYNEMRGHEIYELILWYDP